MESCNDLSAKTNASLSMSSMMLYSNSLEKSTAVKENVSSISDQAMFLPGWCFVMIKPSTSGVSRFPERRKMKSERSRCNVWVSASLYG